MQHHLDKPTILLDKCQLRPFLYNCHGLLGNNTILMVDILTVVAITQAAITTPLTSICPRTHKYPRSWLEPLILSMEIRVMATTSGFCIQGILFPCTGT